MRRLEDSGGHRIRLLDAAQELMLTRGYPATSVDDICSVAGVTKGSFYHHFASKEELGVALVDHFFQKIQVALLTEELAAITEPRARIEMFLRLASQAAAGPLWSKGCIIGNFALDLSETHPEIRATVAARFAALTGVLAEEFRLASVATGRSVDAEALARQFLVSLEGGMVLAKAHADPELVQESLNAFAQTVAIQLGWQLSKD